MVERDAETPAALGAFRWSDLPRDTSLTAAMAKLDGERRDDSAFLHAPRRQVALTPRGIHIGSGVFGPGRSPVMTDDPHGRSITREIASVLLHDARFVASSMSIVDRKGRIFHDGLDNIGGPNGLPDFDGHYRRDAAGGIHLGPEFDHPLDLDCVAMPVCGVGFPNYGHFLFDGLPLAVLYRQTMPRLRIRLVGQRLGVWQRAILAELDLLDDYIEVLQPVRFRHMIASTMLSMHVAYPTAFIRPLFDGLRFKLGVPASEGSRKLFLSRAGDVGRRVLRNRAAVEQRMHSLGFRVVRPELLSFADQIALMSTADIVVAESGAAMANLGFCPPGTRVLEIQPERFVENWTRGMCFHFGHDWNIYLARVDSPMIPDATGAATDPRQVFSFAIDPDDLAAAIERVEAH